MRIDIPNSDITISGIILNQDNLYEGDLKEPFKNFVEHAANLYHPYHNFRHSTHILWLCYQASLFYKDQLSKREIRNLLIAALFHDFDHAGKVDVTDIENIENAIKGLEKHVSHEDVGHVGEISNLIRYTEFPHKNSGSEIPLSGQILRDADLSQVLSNAWMQAILLGLGQERGKTFAEMLKGQVSFLENVTFATEWAQQAFPPEAISRKQTEVQELLKILN